MVKNIKRATYMCLILFILFGVKAQAAAEIKRIEGYDRYLTAIEVSKNGWADGSSYAVIATGENFPDALSAAPLAKKVNSPILLTRKSRLNNETIDELKRLRVKQAYIVGGYQVISDYVEDQLKAMGIRITRLGGEDRYETSLKIASVVGTQNGVFLVKGGDFADALSVAPIAAKKDMPIILSPQKDLTPSLKNFFAARRQMNIYIVGNTSDISENISFYLISSERISGSNKYEKNINVIKRFSEDINFGIIYGATGRDYPDALSASVLAQKTSSPIILLDKEIPEVTKNFIKSKVTPKIRIIGGTSAISYDTEYYLRNLPAGIASINNIAVTINENEKYELPKTVKVLTTNNTVDEVSVSWNLSFVNTGKSGTYYYEGRVEGYSGSVILTLIINPVAVSFDNYSAEVVKNSTFVFPSTVIARLSDGSIREVPVTWSNTVVNIGKIGTYTFTGEIQGFPNKKVTLTLRVVEDSIVYFNDPVLEYEIRKILGKTNYNQTNVYKSDLLGLGSLAINGKGVSNLSGIENASNISYLNISDNPALKDISPIQKLTNLKYLTASGCSIESITPLQNLIRLNYLDIRNNKIKSIAPLKNLTGLTTLYLSGNPIDDLSPVRAYYSNLLSRDFELRY